MDVDHQSGKARAIESVRLSMAVLKQKDG